MAARPVSAWSLVALTLGLGVLVDLRFYAGEASVWSYAIPTLLAAFCMRAQLVALTGVVSLATYSAGALLQQVSPAVAGGSGVGLALLAALASALAYHRELAADRAVRAERAEREAQRARAEAELAVRARDEFVSIAAHELRAPVTSVRGMVYVALRQVDGDGVRDLERLRRSLTLLDRQSSRLARLTHQLLDLSRIDAGKLAIDRQAVDLAEIVQNAAAAAQQTTDYHKISVVAPAPLSIDGDPLRLEQVMINLLDNAIKYSPDGGEIAVEVERVPSAAVHIRVADHGTGIAPEQHDRIFERFYQAHGEGHLKGLGIGLYICRQIVELHGGSIAVDSEVGRGSTFTVRLPLAA